MKAILIIILFVMGMVSGLFAQGSYTELDVDQLLEEMKTEMDAVRAEMDVAMQELQSRLQGMEWEGVDGSERIIINGDTILWEAGTDFFPEDLGEMFRQLPGQMEDFKLHFGGEEMDGWFDGMKEWLQGDFPAPKGGREAPHPNTQTKKKARVYSL